MLRVVVCGPLFFVDRLLHSGVADLYWFEVVFTLS